MQANEFDQLLRQRFDEEELPYKPEMWQQLSQQLPVAKEKKNRLGMFWWQVSGIAAAVAVVIITVIKWQQPVNENPVAMVQTTESSSVLQQNAKPATLPQATEESAALKKQEFIASDITGRNKNVKNKYIHIAKTDHPETGSSSKPIQEEITADISPAGFSDQATDVPAEVLVAEKKKPSFPATIYDPLMLPEADKAHPKTSFSLTGGLNYGSLNTGYTVAVTAQRNISKRIYLEGNIGLVNGNAQATSMQKASLMASPSPNPGPGTYSVQNVKSENQATLVTTTPINLYYFQVAPVIGYNLYKGLSIGVGADIQRLLLNSATYEVKNEAGALQQITTLDLGISGKTEYQISKKIKAGILYRNGLNDVLKNKKYLDRDYLQVQFKYTFIH